MSNPIQVVQPSFADPTETIGALINKFSLSLLILASGILFYEMSNRNISKIPKSVSIYMSIFLIFLSCSISIFATFEFHNIIPKYDNSCNNSNNCLYTPHMLKNVILFYTIFSVLFILSNICIAIVLLVYHK